MCLGEHYILYFKYVLWNFNIILWSTELYQSCAANLPDCLSYAWYCQHICWCSVWCLVSRAAKDTWGNALLWLILIQGAYSYSSNHHGNVSLSQLPRQQLLEPPAKWRGIYLVKYHKLSNITERRVLCSMRLRTHHFVNGKVAGNLQWHYRVLHR